MGLDGKLIDELLAGRSTVAEIAGENGLLKQLTKAILERALAAELTDHLGYEKHTVAGHHSGNSRNGTSKKQLKGDFGTVALEGVASGNGQNSTLSRSSSRNPSIKRRNGDVKVQGHISRRHTVGQQFSGGFDFTVRHLALAAPFAA